MAIVIKVTCGGCGDVALRPDDLVLRIAAHNLGWPPVAQFRCPLCTAVVALQVEGPAVDLLMSCDGVRLELWSC